MADSDWTDEYLGNQGDDAERVGVKAVAGLCHDLNEAPLVFIGFDCEACYYNRRSCGRSVPTFDSFSCRDGCDRFSGDIQSHVIFGEVLVGFPVPADEVVPA